MSNSKNRAGVDFVVSVDALNSIDINKLLKELTSVDSHDIYKVFQNALQSCDDVQKQALELLSHLTYLHFKPESVDQPFSPVQVHGDRRSLIPSDLLSEQVDILAEFVKTIENPGLKARVADIVWVLKRRHIDLAELAIDRYLHSVAQVQSGKMHFAFDQQSACGISGIEYLTRAITISYTTRWNLQVSNEIKPLVNDLINSVATAPKSEEFVRIANLSARYGLSDYKKLADQASELADQNITENALETRIRLLEIAKVCAKKASADEMHESFLFAISECYEKKSDASDSLMNKASFLKDAIDTLRNHPNTRLRRDELHEKMRKVQERMRDEFATVSTKIDLTELAQNSIETVKGLSWPNALITLFTCDDVPTPEDLRKEVEQDISAHPLVNLIPTTVCDFQGRTVFKSNGLIAEEEEGESSEHFKYLMAKQRDHARQVAVSGVISPIRQTISSEHSVPVRIIEELIRTSPFIPRAHSHIFALGISYFIGGADIQASSLLLPQLENSLRHLLYMTGKDTTSDSGGIQTEASLSVLLKATNHWRTDLEELLTTRFVNELDLLFNFPGGPSVRNQFAHGKMPTAAYWDHNTIYGTWLIIQLALLPLTVDWNEIELRFSSITGLQKKN